MSRATAYSESTTSASPAQFSPFSSAFSVSSEATFVSDDRADLGAFQSVFHALSQLQFHHSQQHSNATATTSREGTPSIRGDPMSPLSLTSLQTSPPPSAPFDVTSHMFRPLSADLLSERSISTIDNPRALSTSIASTTSPSSAAEDGDEESAGVSGSPQSLSDNSAARDIFDRLVVREGEGDSTSPEPTDEDPSTPGVWVYSEISPYRTNFQDSSSNSFDSSPQTTTSTYLFDMDPNIDEDGSPSLGDLQSAFAFFATERAKLAGPPDSFVGGGPYGTPVVATPTKKERKYKKGSGKDLAKLKRKQKDKKSSPLGEEVVPEENGTGDLGEEDAVHTETATNASVDKLSSSDLDDTFKPQKPQFRGILPKPPKQKHTTKALPYAQISSSAPSNQQRTSNNDPSLATSNFRGKQAKHRYTRSLPISSFTPPQPTVPVSGSYVSQLRSLARRLAHHFPQDSSSLRKVIKDPARSLGLRSPVGPSDEDLVSGGFFDPASGSGMDSPSKGSNNNTLLYVFVDHSNILIGFLEWLKRQNVGTGKGTPKPRISHPALALFLERGRACARKVLVASSPLYQSLDGIAGMSYQISVLQRVEIKEGASGASTPSVKPGPSHRRSSSFGTPGSAGGPPTLAPPVALSKRGKFQSNASRKNGAYTAPNELFEVDGSTESDLGGNALAANDTIVDTPRIAIVPARNRGSPAKRGHHKHSSSVDKNRLFVGTSPETSSIAASRPRYREEAVDELLQLKLLQTLLDAPSPPPVGSTIVLASGDAARSQFNPQGFLGCVRKALERGWKVEVVGWEEGRSRAWVELKDEVDRITASGEVQGTILGNGGGFEILSLDMWGLDLLDSLA